MRIDNRQLLVHNSVLEGSTYNKTMTRFNNILNDKLGIETDNSLTLGAVDAAGNAADWRNLASDYGNDLRFNTKILNAFDEEKATGKTEMAKPNAKKSKVLSNSGNSAEVIDRKLNGTPMAGLGKVFKDAENRTGVNAYVLAAIAMHESAYGTSEIAQGKNNLFGFQAYDDSPYESAKSYANFSAGIYDVADYLRREYLDQNGAHFKGYDLASIGKSYASDAGWARKVESHLNNLLK